MKSAGLIKKVACTLLVFVLALSFGVPVLAAGGVPNAVTDARSSVVRIAVMRNDYYVGSGSGFAVGRGDDIYIITNWHVIAFDNPEVEDVKFRVYFAEDRYMPATLKGTSAGRDLAILKPVNPIPGLKPLALQTGEVKTGAAGYALGFPGSADDIAGAFLTGKDAITITNGIVSGIRSFSIGDNSRPNTQILQTNIAISGGNSGGPLLDSGGNVIGINTLGATTDSNLFACVHVQELAEYLDISHIAYTTAADKVWGTVIWAALGVFIAGAVVLIVLLLKKRKKCAALAKGKNGIPLSRVIVPGSGFYLNEAATCTAGKKLLTEMAFDLEKFLNGSYPLSPDYVYLSKDGLLSYQPPKTMPLQNAMPQTEASLVYFAGAVLYATYTGTFPPDAAARAAGANLLLTSSPLAALISKSMDLEEKNRHSSMLILLDALNKIEPSAGPFPPSSHGGVYPSTFTGMAPISNFSPSQIMPKKKKRKGLILSVCAGVLVLTFGIYTGAQIYIVSSATKEEDYHSATDAFNRAPWLQLVFKKDYTYVYGLNEWTRGNYQESLRALNELPDEYKEVTAAKQQVSYDMGKAYLEAGRPKEALKVFGSLGNYKDSENLCNKIKIYIDAPQINDKLSQFIAYAQLGDFLDAPQKASELTESLLDIGADSYYNENFSQAKIYFYAILEYASLSEGDRSKLSAYIDATNLALDFELDTHRATPWSSLSVLQQMDSSIDIAPVVLSVSAIDYFLHGDWYSSGGGWFTYNINDHIFDFTDINLPYDTYYFSGGTFSRVSNGKDILSYDYIDYNTLKFTDLRNGRTYTFTRQ